MGFSLLKRREVLNCGFLGGYRRFRWTCCLIFRIEIAGSCETTVTTHKAASILTMEAAVSSRDVSNHKTVPCRNRDELSLNLHHSGNLRSLNYKIGSDWGYSQAVTRNAVHFMNVQHIGDAGVTVATGGQTLCMGPILSCNHIILQISVSVS